MKNLKNNSARLITLSLFVAAAVAGEPGTIKKVNIIPTKEETFTDDEIKHLKENKVVVAWLDDGTLEEIAVKEEKETKLPLSADLINSLSSEELDAKYNVTELRAYAKTLELPATSKMEKVDLIPLLKEQK